jgi:hypothetical protein
MKHLPVRYLVVTLVVVILALIAGGSAGAQGPELVNISNPSEGSTVSGLVAVTGSAEFPDFLKYEVFLKSGDQFLWGATVFAPVINGLLARLDTRTVPDGSYQLVIRKVRSDENYTDFLGPMFTINNGQGAPQPYPEIESSPLYPPQSGRAVVRVRNCSGKDLLLDYGSPTGFCSAGKVELDFKPQDTELCPYADVLVIANCEYRGTAAGLGDPPANFMFDTDPGKIYELIYPGAGRTFLNELPGDERAETDLAALPADDPRRVQAVTSGQVGQAPTITIGGGSGQQAINQQMPASGQAASESSTSFIIAGLGLLLFMIMGGIIAAMRRDKRRVVYSKR